MRAVTYYLLMAFGIALVNFFFTKELALSFYIGIFSALLPTAFLRLHHKHSERRLGVLDSLHHKILPFFHRQLESATNYTESGFHQITHLLVALQQSSNELRTELQGPDVDKHHVVKLTAQIEQINQELAVLMQFSDRLQQKQAGVIEAIALCQQSITQFDHSGGHWNEEELLTALECIKSRTNTEEHTDPSDEGNVTFFH